MILGGFKVIEVELVKRWSGVKHNSNNNNNNNNNNSNKEISKNERGLLRRDVRVAFPALSWERKSDRSSRCSREKTTLGPVGASNR